MWTIIIAFAILFVIASIIYMFRPKKLHEVVNKEVELDYIEHPKRTSEMLFNNTAQLESLNDNTAYYSFMERFLRLTSAHIILDIGCGILPQPLPLFIRERSYTGIDCVENVIKHNTRTHKDIKFLYSDVTDPKFELPIQSPHVILMKDILNYWDDTSIIEFFEKHDCGMLIICFEKGITSQTLYGNRRLLSVQQKPLSLYDTQILFEYRDNQLRSEKQICLVRSKNVDRQS